MKLFSILANTLPPVIVVGLAMGLAMEHQARMKLVAEREDLENQCARFIELAGTNEQLSNLLAQATAPKPLSPDEQMELLRLRGQVGVLRKQSDLDQAREENRQMHAVLERYRETLSGTNNALTADYWPHGSWTNMGYGTPEAALQTSLWAGANGDLTNFMTSLTEGAETNFFDGRYKGKSADEQSVLLADDIYGLQSAQVLSRDVEGDNTVMLTMEFDNQDGFQTTKIIMQKIAGEWKVQGPPQ